MRLGDDCPTRRPRTCSNVWNRAAGERLLPASFSRSLMLLPASQLSAKAVVQSGWWRRSGWGGGLNPADSRHVRPPRIRPDIECALKQTERAMSASLRRSRHARASLRGKARPHRRTQRQGQRTAPVRHPCAGFPSPSQPRPALHPHRHGACHAADRGPSRRVERGLRTGIVTPHKHNARALQVSCGNADARLASRESWISPAS